MPPKKGSGKKKVYSNAFKSHVLNELWARSEKGEIGVTRKLAEKYNTSSTCIDRWKKQHRRNPGSFELNDNKHNSESDELAISESNESSRDFDRDSFPEPNKTPSRGRLTRVKPRKRKLDADKNSMESNPTTGDSNRIVAQRIEIENLLLGWCKDHINKREFISDVVLMNKAQEIIARKRVDFNCSQGWLTRFKERYNLIFPDPAAKKNVAENESLIPVSSTSSKDKDLKLKCEEVVHEKAETFPGVSHGYEPCDIYNVVESSLLYNVHPNNVQELNSEKFVIGQCPDVRFTILMCSNMSGSDKRKLVIIGNQSKPSFYCKLKSCPVMYESSSHSWINNAIFECWLRNFDHILQKQKRQVALIIENTPAHSRIFGLQAIELIYMPSLGSKSQPLDLGVTQHLKIGYRQQLVEKLLQAMGKNVVYTPDKLESIHMLHSAWNRISADTIQQGFEKSRRKFLSDVSTLDNSIKSSDEVEIPKEFHQVFRMLNRIGLICDDISIVEFVYCDQDIAVSAKNAQEDLIDIQQSSNLNGKEAIATSSSMKSLKYNEVLEMLFQVRRYLQTHENVNSDFLYSSVANLENHVLLSGTENYFS